MLFDGGNSQNLRLEINDCEVINKTMAPLRWQRRKAERAPEILQAALCCFAEKGFAATRMDDVAARAHITKGTIYLYFNSKAALFKALARQAVGTQMQDAAQTLETFEGSSTEQLRMVLTASGQIMRTSDGVVLAKIMLAEMDYFPELAEFWRREIIDQGLALFETIIRRGIARGEFRAIVPEHAARLCAAPLLMVAVWRTMFARFEKAPTDYQGLIDAHIETLLRGLAADPPQTSTRA